MRKRAKRQQKTMWKLPRQKGERRRLELFGVVGIVCFASVISGSFFVSSVAHYALRMPNVAAVVSGVLVDLTNADRANDKLANLTMNPELVAAAQAKADDMAAKGYFAHVSPDGTDPWHWFKQAGYSFDYAGENLAVNFSDSGDVNQAWMNSPTHRDNILNPHYTEIGIATAEGTYEGHPAIFVVQEFGSPSSKPAPLPIVSETIPENPTVVATAASEVPTVKTVAARRAAPVVAGAETKVKPTPKAPAISPAPVPNEPPLWAPIVAYPKTTLHYTYYLLAFLILLSLAYVTRFEMRAHHMRHVGVATGLVLMMGVFLIVADFVVFTTPVLAAVAASL